MTSLSYLTVILIIIIGSFAQPYQFVKCPNDNNTYPSNTICGAYSNLEEPFLQEKFDAKEERQNEEKNNDDED